MSVVVPFAGIAQFPLYVVGKGLRFKHFQAVAPTHKVSYEIGCWADVVGVVGVPVAVGNLFLRRVYRKVSQVGLQYSIGANRNALRKCAVAYYNAVTFVEERLCVKIGVNVEFVVGQLDVNYAVEEVESCSACYGMLISALTRLKEDGLLDKLDTRLCIGQGWRGKTGKLGIGNCTKDFEYNIPGCPPQSDDIYDALKKYIENK